ncbi:nuclear transport factor 2 family protein [Solirubrobacter sp. CPCC 204708]|uniref:Nuclear transport factor 2 family protein n=1 Tax=Solirubrobacter deserti TaxID=2282478 RepID=A0ABT4RCQ8_9ACTN|nr:nuclear transport factor 2 family protein [Solirubrobacter deserti]MBE2317906.1 nuclear transport factor 2 family protein [Solirubrobacter deserti]MDA0136317.1 nuclear transport factor 2 family protein [Solirubrobacter deserti]
METLQRLYDAFNAREIDTVLAAMHDDVDWPNGWEGGRLHGKEAVRAYWTRQWAAIDPSVEPVAFDGTAVTVHQVVRDFDGNVLDDREVVHRYELQDGLVTRMDIA